MILTASLMQLETLNQEPEQTQLQFEEEDRHGAMETDLVTFGNLDFDIPSEAELFFKNYKGENLKMFGQSLSLLNLTVLICPSWII